MNCTEGSRVSYSNQKDFSDGDGSWRIRNIQMWWGIPVIPAFRSFKQEIQPCYSVWSSCPLVTAAVRVGRCPLTTLALGPGCDKSNNNCSQAPVHALFMNPWTKVLLKSLLSPFTEWGNEGLRRLNNLLKAIGSYVVEKLKQNCKSRVLGTRF